MTNPFPLNDFDYQHKYYQGFNLQNTIACAYLSRAVYYAWTPFHEVMKNWNVGAVTFDRSGSQAALIHNVKAMFLVFRGTEIHEIQDLKTDLKIRKRRGPLAGRVHRGFLAGLNELWESHKINGYGFKGIEDTIQEYKQFYRDKHKSVPQLYITGHSLGAALATLAAAFLAEDGIPIQQVITFGSPRIGDEEFAQAYNNRLKNRTQRVTNNNDIITRAAPRSFGYSHVGEYCWIKEDGKLDFDITWWERWLDMGNGFLNDLFESGLDSVKDHGIDSYIEQLEKNL